MSLLNTLKFEKLFKNVWHKTSLGLKTKVKILSTVVMLTNLILPSALKLSVRNTKILNQ